MLLGQRKLRWIKDFISTSQNGRLLSQYLFGIMQLYAALLYIMAAVPSLYPYFFFPDISLYLFLSLIGLSTYLLWELSAILFALNLFCDFGLAAVFDVWLYIMAAMPWPYLRLYFSHLSIPNLSVRLSTYLLWEIVDIFIFFKCVFGWQPTYPYDYLSWLPCHDFLSVSI